MSYFFFFFFNDTATTEIYTLSLHDALPIYPGKGRGSRRRVPCTERVRGILEMRSTEATSEWVFPAQTKSGHIESLTLKKPRSAALKAALVSAFVIYDLRHTCITRWAKTNAPARARASL